MSTSITPISFKYSALVGSLPRREAMAASSALPRYTLVFLPRRLGKLRVLVELVKTDLSQTKVDRKTYTVGYDHFLSKPTDVYAMFMGDKITNQTSGTSFGVGIRHRF